MLPPHSRCAGRAAILVGSTRSRSQRRRIDWIGTTCFLRQFQVVGVVGWSLGWGFMAQGELGPYYHAEISILVYLLQYETPSLHQSVANKLPYDAVFVMRTSFLDSSYEIRSSREVEVHLFIGRII